VALSSAISRVKRHDRRDGHAASASPVQRRLRAAPGRGAERTLPVMPVAREVAKATLVVAGVAAGLYLLYRLREVVALLVMSVFVAVALAPMVQALAGLKVPRVLAILLVYAALVGSLFVAGLLLVPPIVGQVDQLARHAPQYVTAIRDSETLRRYDQRYGITAKVGEQADKLPRFLNDAAGELEAVSVGVFRRGFELLTVLTLAFFLLLDGPRFLDAAFSELGSVRERRARALAVDSSRAVGGYVAGTLAIGALAGAASFAMMTALGLPFAVPLAVLMVFLALIPLVGSTIGAVPIALMAGLHSFPTALVIWVLFFVVYQQLESRLLGPFVYRRTVAVHPLIAIVAVLAGASLAGILGALLAIPAAAIVQILLRDWWRLRAPGARPATELSS
jgi:predicted PurR-regulated permease PerM